MLQIFLTATPIYQRFWFWVLAVFVTLFLLFYGLRWFARRRYREIMESRRRANARIRTLLEEMKKRNK